jgi:hypothetical protein
MEVTVYNNIKEEITNKLNELSEDALAKIKTMIDKEISTKYLSDGYIVPHKLYKHINNSDVAFVSLGVGFTSDEVICNGYWVNITNPKKFYLLDADTVKISTNDISNWKVLEWPSNE